MFVLNRGFFDPFGTAPFGQVVLLGAGLPDHRQHLLGRQAVRVGHFRSGCSPWTTRRTSKAKAGGDVPAGQTGGRPVNLTLLDGRGPRRRAGVVVRCPGVRPDAAGPPMSDSATAAAKTRKNSRCSASVAHGGHGEGGPTSCGARPPWCRTARMVGRTRGEPTLWHQDRGSGAGEPPCWVAAAAFLVALAWASNVPGG